MGKTQKSLVFVGCLLIFSGTSEAAQKIDGNRKVTQIGALSTEVVPELPSRTPKSEKGTPSTQMPEGIKLPVARKAVKTGMAPPARKAPAGFALFKDYEFENQPNFQTQVEPWFQALQKQPKWEALARKRYLDLGRRELDRRLSLKPLHAQARTLVTKLKRELNKSFQEDAVPTDSPSEYERFLGRLEVREAAVTVAGSAYKTELFERGLTRIATLRWPIEVPKVAIDAYVNACQAVHAQKTGAPQFPTSGCAYWLKRVQDVFPKGANETASIAAAFPTLPDWPEPMVDGGRFSQSYPPKKMAPDEESFEEGLKEALDGNRSGAFSKWEKFGQDFPRSYLRYREKYWKSHLRLQASKDLDDAKKELKTLAAESSFSWYGLLAATDLKMPLKSMFPEVGFPVSVSEQVSLTPWEAEAQARLKEALAWNGFWAARELLSGLSKRSYSSPYLVYLYQAAIEAHDDLFALRAALELIQRQETSIRSWDFMKSFYPFRYWDLVKNTAEKYGLDPVLALSLIRQESTFMEEIHSPSGAVGLMQIMPATGLEVDSKLELWRLTTKETNVDLGTRYLKSLLDRYNGNVMYALAAYNAGPSRVNRWKKEAKPDWKWFEFVEAIPYKETRDYVGQILKNYVWYQRLLGNETEIKFEDFWAGRVKPGAEPVSPATSSSTLRRAAPAPARAKIKIKKQRI